MEIIEKINELIYPYLLEKKIELVDIMYRRESSGMVLRLLVDTDEGIRMDECEALNNYLGSLLDINDIIKEHFVLEVSSPGLDRPIKTDRDFERAFGKEIDVTTYEPINKRKVHYGRLVEVNRDSIVLNLEGDEKVILPRSKIAMARLSIKF